MDPAGTADAVEAAVAAVSTAVRGEPLQLPEKTSRSEGFNPAGIVFFLIFGLPFIGTALVMAMLAGCGLPGFANWMRAQAQEEMFHGMKIYDYILERGGSIDLKVIDKPSADWSSPLAVAEEVAAHEAKVTGLINDLVEVAMAEKDHASNIFLQWFVAEQVEEEAAADDLLQHHSDAV